MDLTSFVYSCGRLAGAALVTALLSGCTATITQASFFPDRQLPAPDASLVTPAGYVKTDETIPLDGLGLVRVVRLDNPASRTVVIYSAGNGGFVDSPGSSRFVADLAATTGADILLYDYSGRGGTTVPATIDASLALGPAMIDQFARRRWIGEGPLYAYGLSFGGSMAAAMARQGGFAGLILEGTATDMKKIGRDFVPGLLRPFVKLEVAADLRRFDYRGYVLQAKAPVLLLSGTRDPVIRPKRMRQLADDLRSQGTAVTFQPVPTAHGGALATAEGRAAIKRFVGSGSPAE